MILIYIIIPPITKLEGVYRTQLVLSIHVCQESCMHYSSKTTGGITTRYSTKQKGVVNMYIQQFTMDHFLNFFDE